MALERGTRAEWMPLHPAQRGIYYQQRATPTSPKYNVGGYIRVKGRFDTVQFRASLGRFWHSNEAERLQVSFVDGEPLQRVRGEVDMPELTTIELMGDASSKRTEAMAWMQERMDLAFDMHVFPLFEHALLPVDGNEVWYFSRHHHICVDAYSFGLKIDQVLRNYMRSQSGEPPNEVPAMHYADEVDAATRYLDSDDFTRDQIYWKDKYRSAPDLIWPDVYGVEIGDALSVPLPSSLQRDFLAVVQAAGVGPMQGIMVLTMLHLARTRGTLDAVVGVPLHNRVYRRQKLTFGKFSAIIPARVTLDARAGLLEALRTLQRSLSEDLLHRHFNHWSGVVQQMNLQDSQRRALFELVVNYEPFIVWPQPDGARVSAQELTSSAQSVPMHVRLCDFGAGQPLMLKVDAISSVLPAEGIRAVAEGLLDTMRTALERPECPLDELFDSPSGEHPTKTTPSAQPAAWASHSRDLTSAKPNAAS